MSVIFNLYMNH